MYSKAILHLALSATVLGASALAYAGGDHGGSVRPSTTVVSKASVNHEALTEGEIKKIDKDAEKVTIKHGELKNLGMPAMTMVFQVKEKSVLNQFAKGDKVKFVAEKVDGKFVITHIVPLQEKH